MTKDTSANLGTVTFTATWSGFNAKSSNELEANDIYGGIELTNTAGKVGYVSNGVVGTKDAGTAGYFVATVTVTAALSGAEEGVTLASALSQLATDNAQVKLVISAENFAIAKLIAGNTPTSSELSSLYSTTVTIVSGAVTENSTNEESSALDLTPYVASTNVDGYSLNADATIASWPEFKVAIGVRAQRTDTTAESQSVHNADKVVAGFSGTDDSN